MANIVNTEKCKKPARGEVEFIIKDRNGNIIDRHIEPNLVKIFAKEMLAHQLPHSKVWDPDADTGLGDWVASTVDPDEDFSAKYILFGASFDESGVPLDTDDSRYYTSDDVTGGVIPIRLGVGAEFNGGLINAVPIAEPNRPLKRIEKISFTPTYQPARPSFSCTAYQEFHILLLKAPMFQFQEDPTIVVFFVP